MVWDDGDVGRNEIRAQLGEVFWLDLFDLHVWMKKGYVPQACMGNDQTCQSVTKAKSSVSTRI